MIKAEHLNDWLGRYGIGREDVYEILFRWLPALSSQWETPYAERTIVSIPPSELMRTIRQDVSLCVQELNGFYIKCGWQRNGIAVLRDVNDTCFSVLVEKANDEACLRLSDVGVGWHRQENRKRGIAKYMAASAVELACALGYEKVGCFPGDMGSFVWLRLGGIPCEWDSETISGGKILNRMQDALDQIRSPADRAWLEALRNRKLPNGGRDPLALVELAQSEIKIGKNRIGLIILNDVVLGLTFFDLRHPVTIAALKKHDVCDVEALKRKYAPLSAARAGRTIPAPARAAPQAG